DGAQAGTDRLPGAQAWDDVRASESGGVRGPDEGQAGQGAAAEGAPVGAGGNREDVGRRCNGSRSAGGGGKTGKRISAGVGRRGRGGRGQDEGRQTVSQVSGPGRERCARRRTRENDHLGALGKLSGRGSLQPTQATPKAELPSACRTSARKGSWLTS